MRKKVLTILILILLAFPKNALGSYFPDVPDSHTNSEAINWLQTNTVIEGYPDGTFKPADQINRVELLKIIIEGFDYPLDVNEPTGFPDINEDEWYAKYVRKAKSLGWIQGYPDGSYKPDQSINKAETLKILGKVKNWELTTPSQAPFDDTPKDEWYTPFVSYAKNKNFLEETGQYFSPASYMVRAKFSEMIYRIIAVENSGASAYYDGLTPETVVGLIQTIDSSIYPKNHFTGVTLKEDFQNIFYLNEIYIFEADLAENKSECFAYLSSNNYQTYQTFLGQIKNESCIIPVIFENPGVQYFGIIPGLSGYTPSAEIEVLRELPPFSGIETASEPTNLNTKFEDDKTYFTFSNNGTETIKITLTQDDKIRTFINRQKLNEINIPYTSFEGFSTGNVKWYIEGAKSLIDSETDSNFTYKILSPWKKSSTKTFIAAVHSSGFTEKNKIEMDSYSSFQDTNKEFTLTGKSLDYIERTSYIISPEGLVYEQIIQSDSPITDYYGKSLYSPGSEFSLNYTPNKTGTYLVEINDKEGVAVFNSPIYVGNIVPLIPDYFDLNQFEDEKNEDGDITSLQNELLAYINEERNELNLPPLSLDQNLNAAAQSHSDDMAENNYFSHISLDGKTVDDRRLKYGIPMPVSENIAKAGSIEAAHEGLMNSAAHRANIISEEWEIIGLGIAVDNEGYFLITQNFSVNSLTGNDLSNYETNLLSGINDFRFDNNKTDLIADNSLMQAAKNWSTKMAEQNFFSFESPSSESISDELLGIPGEFGFMILEGDFQADFLSLAKEKQNTLLSSLWSNMGVGAFTDTITGNIKFTLIFGT